MMHTIIEQQMIDDQVSIEDISDQGKLVRDLASLIYNTDSSSIAAKLLSGHVDAGSDLNKIVIMLNSILNENPQEFEDFVRPKLQDVAVSRLYDMKKNSAIKSYINRLALSIIVPSIRKPLINFVFTSDAQLPITKFTDNKTILGTAVRSSDILMYRINQIENEYIGDKLKSSGSVVIPLCISATYDSKKIAVNNAIPN